MTQDSQSAGVRLIGRDSEMASLQTQYDRPGGRLVLVFGRRRIGKSYLLQAFSEGRPTVFYQATQQAADVELTGFTAAVAPLVGGEYLPAGYRFPDWETALDFLVERNRAPRLLVVLDEFPYLLESTPGLPSIVQRWWDQRGKNSSIMLVLCGSAQTIMEELEGAAAPLHQRFTGRLHVGPLSYKDAALFIPELEPADKARVFGVLGGTPLYLEQWNQKQSLRENLVDLFGDPTSGLPDSAELVLTSDLPDTTGFYRTLQAIGLGKTRASEIKDFAKITPERVLQRLIQLRLIERRTPATDDPERSKRSYYAIADPYFRFFFRFISRTRGEIDRGFGEQVVDNHILPYFEQHMGSIFEDIARAYVRTLVQRSDLPSSDRIGSWWSTDGQHEIDVVGTRGAGEVTVVGSVKWQAEPLGQGVLHDLEADCDALGVPEDLPRLLIGRGGIDRALRRRGIRGFAIDDMYG